MVVSYPVSGGESAHLAGGKMEERTEPRQWGSWCVLDVVANVSNTLRKIIVEKTIREMIDIQRTGARRHPTLVKMRVSQPAARDLNSSHEMLFHEAWHRQTGPVWSCTECQCYLFSYLLCLLCLDGRVAAFKA